MATYIEITNGTETVITFGIETDSAPIFLEFDGQVYEPIEEELHEDGNRTWWYRPICEHENAHRVSAPEADIPEYGCPDCGP